MAHDEMKKNRTCFLRLLYIIFCLVVILLLRNTDENAICSDRSYNDVDKVVRVERMAMPVRARVQRPTDGV